MLYFYELDCIDNLLKLIFNCVFCNKTFCWAIIFTPLHCNNKSNGVFLTFCWKPQKFTSCNKDTYTPISFLYLNKFTKSFLIYLACFYDEPGRLCDREKRLKSISDF